MRRLSKYNPDSLQLDLRRTRKVFQREHKCTRQQQRMKDGPCRGKVRLGNSSLLRKNRLEAEEQWKRVTRMWRCYVHTADIAYRLGSLADTAHRLPVAS